MHYLRFLPVVLVVTTADCDGQTVVRGRVADQSGKPVPGASVKLTEDPDHPGRGHKTSTTTDENGRFSVSIIHAPTKDMPFLLELTGEGFVPHSERLTGTATYEKEIVLEPAKK